MLLLRTAAVRQLEAAYLPQAPLMERAGLAAADLACELVGADQAPVLLLAGGGNNGGDAYVCARHLKARGFDVVVASPASQAALPADAEVARAAWLAAGGRIEDALPESQHFALAIDGLFGIGIARPVEGVYAEWIDRLNRLHCPVLALDVPSGLNADTGAVMGCCVRAAHTLTFLAAKPGLYTLDGRDHAGVVHVAALDTDASQAVKNAEHAGRLISSADFESALRPRPHASHKGTHGDAAIVGGAPGMAGAALLAGRAALHLGAGRVYLGMLETLPADPLQPELMLREVADALERARRTGAAVGIGPGLGRSEGALTALRLAVACDAPLAIDADALNLIAADERLADEVARRQAPTLLTPHPAEAARLLACGTDKVQADRIAAAQALVQRFNAAVALKGSGTVVALQDGRWYINGSGNPALATAGTGDVLLGFVAALLAQGNDTATALLAAVHLHGAAADALVAADIGPVGLTAGELISAARWLWNDWIKAQ